jgi:IPT/TIG domain
MKKLPKPILKYTHFYVFLIFCIIIFTSCAGLYIRSPNSTNPPSTISSPVIITINVDDVHSDITEVKLTDMTPGITNTVIIAPSLFHWINSRTQSCSYTVNPGTKYKLEVSGKVYNATYHTFRSKTISTDFLVSGVSPSAPTISSLSPASGPSGTQVHISGSNLQAINAVTFGTANGTNLANVNPMGLDVTVPPNINGTVQVSATNGTQQAISPISFTATAVTATPAPLVIRSSATDVQSFDFTVLGTPSIITPSQSNLKPGNSSLSVALATDAMGTVLVRSSSQNLESFRINSAGQVLATISTVSATPTSIGTGVFINSSGTQVVRSSDKNIQVFALSGSTISSLPLGTWPATGVSTTTNGNAVKPAFIGGKSLAVRACDDGIKIFDISTPSAITLFGEFTTGFLGTAPGAGISIFGTTAIRAYSGGIEVYSLPATPLAPVKIGSNTMGHPSSGVDVVTDGRFIIRATNEGIEVYDFISSAGPITKRGSIRGESSSTGVAITMIGNRVFRAYDKGIEEYDITDPVNIVPRSNFIMNVTTGQTGVGITLK